MEITEKLIERFLNGFCTPAEADAVDRFFKKNPDILQHYLRHDWLEAGLGNQPLADEDGMFREIKKKTTDLKKKRNPAVVVKIGLRAAVVAASFLLIFGGYYYLHPVENKNQFAANNNTAVNKTDTETLSYNADWQTKVNTTTSKMVLKLTDGSIVTLLPNSSIRYASKFTDNPDHTRNIYLKGQAFFDVAKNVSRPFSVFAGNTATTVLGTYFSVHENAKGIMVKLYSGKVKIHAVNRRNKQPDIFLKPGEQMKYVLDEDLAIVSHFDNVGQTSKPTQSLMTLVTDDMNFNNTSLTEVLDKLGKHYHTNIFYDKKELSDMYFSGKVLESDSLNVILKVIGNMNGLQVRDTTDGFVAHKTN